jgi:hypothetical protein
MEATKPKPKWKRRMKSLFDASTGIIVLILIINAYRYGWLSFIIVILVLLSIVYYTQKEIIMNTAQMFQWSLWGQNMTLQDLKGKKVKFVFGRGKKKNERKIKNVVTSKEKKKP